MEANRRRNTSVRQLELLITFMEEHRDLALGRVRSREARALSCRLWAQCSTLLNAEGVARSPKEWSKFWNDYKSRVRGKLTTIRKERNRTGGGLGTAAPLTTLEERVAAILGSDVGPISGVRMDPVLDVVVQNERADSNVFNGQQVSVNADSADSFIIDISNIGQDLLNNDIDRTLTVETPPHIETQNNIGNNIVALTRSPIAREPTRSPIAREPTRSPIHTENVHEQTDQQLRRERRPRRPRPRGPVQYSNTAALDEARATISRIEEMRARTEEATALANLKRAEADLKNAESFSSIALSLKIIADSIKVHLTHT